MNDVKEFMKGLPKVSESRVLSTEEQEMVGSGSCESCKNSCEPGGKRIINRTTDIHDVSVDVL